MGKEFLLFFFEEEARKARKVPGREDRACSGFSAEKRAVLRRGRKVSCGTSKCLMKTGTCRVGQAQDLVSNERVVKW